MGAEPTKTLLQRSLDTLTRAQAALSAQIEHVSRALETKRASDQVDPQLGSHLAWLTEKQAGVTREARQIESHEREAAEAMTDTEADTLLAEHLLALPVDRRAAILARVAAAHADGSVL